MTYKEIAIKVLKSTKKLMSPLEILEYAKKHLAGIEDKISNAQTPEQSIGAQIYTEINNNGLNSIFIKHDTRMKFGLHELIGLYGNELYNDNLVMEYKVVNDDDVKELESQMHKPFVTYLRLDPRFMLYAKTINASKSDKMKKGMYEWEHPDIIAVKFANTMYRNAFETILKNKENLFELYSFELKKSVDLSDVSLKYFQAVSNSSWANYGYLVINDIDDSNPDLMEKIKILNDSFGIGVIKFDVDLSNLDRDKNNVLEKAKILVESKRNGINYKYLNRFLGRNNDDINDFFKSVNGQAESTLDINPTLYDEVYDI